MTDQFECTAVRGAALRALVIITQTASGASASGSNSASGSSNSNNNKVTINAQSRSVSTSARTNKASTFGVVELKEAEKEVKQSLDSLADFMRGK